MDLSYHHFDALYMTYPGQTHLNTDRTIIGKKSIDIYHFTGKMINSG
ncbi:hypothetical protein TREVI0001_1785 [Treponema vincentii ATCC 35580]|uniref:Uncharacterized protein n=1 Tax=Treponema vincentii ATCC 35580 TaxID=596324 RepID=C8PT58_9SPIR|nr:hypothetical protein TREVI0001_1785 [Treponema vincentii ATCC 35580]